MIEWDNLCVACMNLCSQIQVIKEYHFIFYDFILLWGPFFPG